MLFKYWEKVLTNHSERSKLILRLQTTPRALRARYITSLHKKAKELTIMEVAALNQTDQGVFDQTCVHLFKQGVCSQGHV